ncbi:MAG TPA: carboxypeptidase-like regulatory domain-containing protein [Vicinamibacterales bacterium]|nr:carboxypeptidase-like regulatory domain-containing protein [Vicinamibacterales bacterium]
MRLISSVAVVLVTAAVAHAQPPDPQPLVEGASSIRGTLTDEVTKAPIAGCSVHAAQFFPPKTLLSTSVTTGADGAYEFAGIADGTYSLSIHCPSHLPACVLPGGSRQAPCGTLILLKDQQRSGLDFRLTPGAVARGRVVDGAGRPVPKATVVLGGPFNRSVPYHPITTNADGTFELTQLPEGKWRLEVDLPLPPDGPRPPRIYYPGVMTRDEAGFVELAAGGVTANITITVPRVLDSALTVRVPRPDATIPPVSVSLIRPSPLMNRRLELDTEGRAVVRGLTEGRYVLTATGRSTKQVWVAHQAVAFFGDPMDISLHLQPAGRIRGRIVTNRGRLPPLNDSTVGAVWVDEDVMLNPLTPEQSRVAADGKFEISGLFGTRKLQLLRFDPDWRIQAVMQGRRDVTAGINVVPHSITDVTIIVRQR